MEGVCWSSGRMDGAIPDLRDAGPVDARDGSSPRDSGLPRTDGGRDAGSGWDGTVPCDPANCPQPTADCTRAVCTSTGCGFATLNPGEACGGGRNCLGDGGCDYHCRITSILVPRGTKDPQNACKECRPEVEVFQYSSSDNGTSCNDNGLFCDGLGTCWDGACVIRGPDCTPPTPWCSEELDLCVGCVLDLHCAPTGHCDPEDHFCKPCLVDSHCPDEGYCFTGRCQEHQCGVVPLTCSDPTLHCSNPLQRCVQCTDHAHCPEASPRCNRMDGTCVECLEDGDCRDNQWCNGEESCDNHRCVAGAPACAGTFHPTCNESQDRCECTLSSCPPGSTCTGGFCISTQTYWLDDDDDGYQDPNQGNVVVGVGSAASSVMSLSSPGHVGAFRFRLHSIPRHARILGARLRGYLDSDSEDTARMDIFAEASGNAPALQGGIAHDILNRTRTAVHVDWDQQNILPNAPNGDWCDTPELKTVVQDIVNRDDWNAGNHLLLILMPWRFISSQPRLEYRQNEYDSQGTYGATLFVTFSPGD